MSGVSRFKFSAFTLAVLFGLLALTSSSAFDDDEEELRGYEDDRSVELDEDVRQWHHYGHWQRPVQHVVQPHYGHYPQYPQPQYPQPVKVVPQMPKCNNLPQCKPCKAPTVPSYQPKSPRAARAQPRSYSEESPSKEEYETRYSNYQQSYYYKTTQPPRPRQCSDVCLPPVPVTTTKKPYVQQHYQQQQHYQHQQYQHRPSGYGR